jgi:hypothetical protein
MKFSSFWIVVFLIQSGFVLSQTIKEHDNRVWAGYMTEAKINDKFSFEKSFNIEDVLKIDLKERNIKDIGKYSHRKIEDFLYI